MSLLPFTLFALVASITPGPTNILVLSHSSRHGLGATLPIIVGACVAAALMVLGVGLVDGAGLRLASYGEQASQGRRPPALRQRAYASGKHTAHGR